MSAAATLERHHASARKMVLAVSELLVNLETGQDTSIELKAQISQHLNSLAREIRSLELALNESGEGAAQRAVWRKRISHLNEESVSQRTALSRFAAREHSQQRELEERQALLERRLHGGGEHAIMIDDQARESLALCDAGAQLDALTGNATAALGALRDQRGTLKNVQRRVLDVVNKLGLSNNVMRVIESRQFWDKMLVYGGMLMTLALLWFVFVYLRREEPAESP